MSAPDYFIPNRDPQSFYPLQNYLRAVPASVAEKYIDVLTAPGDLVIDPFAGAPTVMLTAQAMGRRAIAVESNPLWAWLARAMATRPSGQEIDAALAQLGDTLKDDVPLRAHIAQLYATTCATCREQTPADYFVHARGTGLIQRHYTCIHCGETRDDPPAEDDLRRAASFDAHGMHYHLAFERVAPPQNLHAERIRKMLAVYTPRNLYALVTLTLKIDSLFHSTQQHEILLLLLLHLLDRGSSFYGSADAVAQLTTHKQSVEFNLWREMELAARALSHDASPRDLAPTPLEVVESDAPAGFVGRGSAKSLALAIPPTSTALVVATLPSRRLAVWALSYFWGAWILGRTAALPLAPFLDSKKDATWERRWYFDSLVQSLTALAKILRPNAHVAFAFNESWQEVIEVLLLAAASTRYDLDTFVFQPRAGDYPRREFDDVPGDYRIVLMRSASTGGGWGEGARVENGSPRTGLLSAGATELEKRIQATALEAGADILKRRGEPLAFSWVHHAAYTRALRDGLLARAMAVKSKTPPGRWVHNAVLAGLSEGYAHDFDHYESQSQFVWLRRSPELDLPLIDRVEDAVRDMLVHGAPVSRSELEDAIYRQFPGELTPEGGLVDLCAAAYAELGPEGFYKPFGSAGDAGKSRALDLLTHLGQRLEYIVVSDFRVQGADDGLSQKVNGDRQLPIRNFDLVWLMDGEIAYGFIWRAGARFTDVARVHVAPSRGYLVVPETFVALLHEKARRQPHLADALNEAGWDFLRVPSVEKLLAAEKVERNDIALMGGLVPAVAEQRAQLELF